LRIERQSNVDLFACWRCRHVVNLLDYCPRENPTRFQRNALPPRPDPARLLRRRVPPLHHAAPIGRLRLTSTLLASVLGSAAD